MHADWQQYLHSAGARIENHAVSHFGDPRAELHAAQTGTILCDLSHFSLLCFYGEDSRTFLHSQLSSDVLKLTAATAQYSSYCTPKGRVLASFLLWQSGDGYFAQLHGGLRESIQNRLAKFVLRSKVKISDASSTYIPLGLAGNNSEMLAIKCFSHIPQPVLGVAHHEAATLIRLSPDRFQIITDSEQAPALWEKLSRSATAAGNRCWDWLNIRNGIPVVAPATQEQFVPQMLNMQFIGAVNFNKGCYPGQEIIARTQHLGMLKRRMYPANIRSETSPQPGEELFSGDAQGQASGMIVNAAASPEGGYDVLAVIQITSAHADDVHWKSPGGPVLKWLPLPYPV
jgi:folate-binding protein YgfZ